MVGQISGRQALGSIDETLGKARRQTDAVHTQVREASERLLDQQRDQARDYRTLARIRLGELSGTATLEHLDDTERQVLALLERRDALQAELDGNIEQNRALLGRYEAQRAAQQKALDEAVAIVDGAEEAVQKRLDADADYRAQRERAEAAERRAVHAADKAQLSSEEREAKGEAYEQDPLFMYLWQRDFGLPGYRAGGLVRWLDGKVARLIAYDDARANYARLIEIPKRLAEHAERLRTLSDSEFERLRERDEAARKADGVDALEQRVVQLQAELDETDGRIDEREQAEQSMLADKTAYAAGEDPSMREAISFLAREFEREDLVALRYAAIRTPYPEDDVVVSRMLQREDEQQRLESGIAGLKGTLQQHQQRVRELERLRADFKRNRFDRSGSIFTDGAIVPSLLREFLAGVLDSGVLWKVLREHQRYRPRRSDPGFGSGGFGRGTVWKGGMGDLGDIFGGIGRGGFGGRGGGGGGGFRTGGGF